MLSNIMINEAALAQYEYYNLIPTELWLKIFLYLDLETIINCTLVAKGFRQTTNMFEVRNHLLSFYFKLNAASTQNLAYVINLKRNDDVAQTLMKIKRYRKDVQQFIMQVVDDNFAAAENYQHTTEDIIKLLDYIIKPETLHSKLPKDNNRLLNILYRKITPSATTIETQLYVAIYCHQSLTTIEPLLTQCENLNATTFHQSFLFIFIRLASSCGHFTVLQHLLNLLVASNTINVLEIINAVELAVRNNHIGITQYLLSHLLQNNIDVSPCSFTIILTMLANKGHIKLMEYIFNYFAASIAPLDLGFALIAACSGGHLPIVKYLINLNPTIVNFKYKETPLITACHEGHYTIAQYLLANGADVNQTIKSLFVDDSKTALISAVQANHKHIVNLLLMYGAKDDVCIHSRFNALAIAIERGYSDIIDLILQYLPEQINTNGQVIIQTLFGKNLNIIEQIISYTGNDNLHYEEHVEYIDRYNPPLKYAYNESRASIPAVFRGIVKFRLKQTHIHACIDDKSITVLGRLLRFIYECKEMIDFIYTPGRKSSEFPYPIPFAKGLDTVHYNRYALNAALALEAFVFENKPEATLAPFLLLLNGKHPILSKIYQHVMLTRDTYEDYIVPLKYLF